MLVRGGITTKLQLIENLDESAAKDRDDLANDCNLPMPDIQPVRGSVPPRLVD
jgi:hypothetical protein